MPNTKLLSALIIGFLSTLSAQAQSIITLSDAVKGLLANNYNIRIAKSDAEVANLLNTWGIAGAYPTLHLEGQYNGQRANVDQTFANGQEQAVNGAQTNAFTGAAVLEWTFFDGFRMVSAKRTLEANTVLNNTLVQAEAEMATRQLIDAYTSAYLAEGQAKIAKQSIQISKAKMKLVEERYLAGLSPRSEQFQVSSEVLSDSLRWTNAKNDSRVAKSLVALIMGDSTLSYDFALPDTLILPEPIPFEELSAGLAKTNPNLLAARANLVIAEERINTAKAATFPQFGLFTRLNAAYQNAQAGFVLNSRSQGVNYGVTAYYSIFNGGLVRKTIQQQEILLKKNKSEIDRISLELKLNLQQSYLNYSNAVLASQVALSAESNAWQALKIGQERYEAGKSDLFELNQLQLSWINAKNQVLAYHSQAIRSWYTCLVLAGRLTL